MSVKYVVSLKDIANQAEVSITTVSRALQGKGEIGRKTREKILRTADELGYRSNLLISGMRTGKTKTIGVMIPNGESYFSQIISAIHDKLIEKDYVPILIWPDHLGKNEKEQIHRLIEHRVEGIIIRPVEDFAQKDYFTEIFERGVPVVTVDRQLSYVDFPFVGSNDYHGAVLATRKLIALGHKKIGHFQGPQFTSPGRERRKGFEDVLAENPEVSGVISEAESFGGDKNLAIKFLKQHPDITAVFAANDNVAVALSHAAGSLRIPVPEQLSIIGYGNLTIGEVFLPSISTVDQFPKQIGEKAVEMLFKQINREGLDERDSKILIEPQIVIRDSVKKT